MPMNDDFFPKTWTVLEFGVKNWPFHSLKRVERVIYIGGILAFRGMNSSSVEAVLDTS